jgi:hypothetical protein
LPSEHAQENLARVRSLPSVTDAALHAGGWLIVSTNKTEPRQGWALAEALGQALGDALLSGRADGPDLAPSEVEPVPPTVAWHGRCPAPIDQPDAPTAQSRGRWHENQRAFALDSDVSFVIIVDASVDVHDPQIPFFHWLAHSDLGRDAWIFASSSDPRDQCRSTLVIDATPKLPGEERHGEPVRRWPPILSTAPALNRRARELLVTSLPSSSPPASA